MQNHPLPTLWASLALGMPCKVDTDVLPCAAPIQQGLDAIAWTALVSLSLLDPRASVRLTPCIWLLPILALLI